MFEAQIQQAGEGNLSRPISPELASTRAAFAHWHEEPPADPHFLNRVRHLRWNRLWAVLGAGLAISLYLAILFMAHGHFVAFIYGIFPFGAALLRGAWTKRATPSVAHLMDVPPVLTQFPVEITLEADGLRYAKDAGVVSITETWFNFQGLRTNFSLNVADVFPNRVPVRSGKLGSSHPNYNLWLDYKVDGTNYRLKVSPMDEIPGVGTQYRFRFAFAVNDWLATPRTGVHNTMLPPRLPHEAEVRRLQTFETMGQFMVGLCGAAILGWAVSTLGLIRAEVPLFVGIVSFIFLVVGVKFSIDSRDKVRRLVQMASI